MLLLGAAGLTFDVGRMYIARKRSAILLRRSRSVCRLETKREARRHYRRQGRRSGHAETVGASEPGRSIRPEPPLSSPRHYAGPWNQNPNPADDYVYARVSTSVPLPMFLMPVLTGQFQSTISARATAKQVPISGTPNNIFPFAPFWMVPGGSNPCWSHRTVSGGSLWHGPGPHGIWQRRTIISRAASTRSVARQIGMTWPATCVKTTKPTNSINTAKQSGIPDRGFIWDTNSMSDIKDAIQGNAVPEGGDSINIGDNVITNCDFCLIPGMRQSAANANPGSGYQRHQRHRPELQSPTWSKAAGNSRRIVVVPMVTGVCGTFGSGRYAADCPDPTLMGRSFGANTVIGFASFFLLPASNYTETPSAPSVPNTSDLGDPTR